jgi:cytochrome c553
MRACYVPLARLAVAPVLSLFASLMHLPSAFAASAQVGSAELAASVRGVIVEHCGRCHDGARPTANPAALRVFDLRAADWTRPMSEEQLKKVTGRTKSLDLTEELHAAIAQFIEVKLSERLASGPSKSGRRSTKPRGEESAR